MHGAWKYVMSSRRKYVTPPFLSCEDSELTNFPSDIRYLFGAEGDMDHILSNLELRETLTDDYMTHDIIIPDFSTTYNSRLHIANVKKELFSRDSIPCVYHNS